MRAKHVLWAVLALPAQASPGNLDTAVKTRSCGIISDKMLLDGLNGFRESLLNPEIDKSLPDPLTFNVGESGRADAGCIIKNPFGGGCICRASASYSVSLKEVKGLKGLTILNFTTAHITNSSFKELDLVLGADINSPDLTVDQGDAHASASACGISPSASGSASTHATPQKPRLTATGKGIVKWKGWLPDCIQLSLNKIDIDLPQFKVHDTTVKINIGPIPGVDLGKIVDLVGKLAPVLTEKIADAVDGPLSKALTKAATDLPCIPIFHEEAMPCSMENTQILV